MGDEAWEMPLGLYRQMRSWAGRTFDWSAGQATFGAGVVDNLVAGIVEFYEEQQAHRAADPSRWNSRAVPVAVGCVPWLTSSSVVDALLPYNKLVIVDKGCRSRQLDRLQAGGRGMWPALLGTSGYAPARDDGAPRVLGMYDDPDEIEDAQYEPVRVVGWSPGPHQRPLLHTKMLVLGTTYFYDDIDYGGPRWMQVTPERLWFGSANWTAASASHLEFGTWIDNDTAPGRTPPSVWSAGPVSLVQIAFEHLKSLLLFSEPLGSGTTGPEPNLAEVEVEYFVDWEHDDPLPGEGYHPDGGDW